MFLKEKKGRDEKISGNHVQQFLKVYWQYMKTNTYIDQAKEFPSDVYLDVKKRVLGHSTEDKFTKKQFLQLWFLFDNPSPEESCPIGERGPVLRSAMELHKCLRPNISFESDAFESIFLEIDSDHDGVLTCKGVELLYYMYSLHVCSSL